MSRNTFTQGYSMKTEWLVTVVTPVGPLDSYVVVIDQFGRSCVSCMRLSKSDGDCSVRIRGSSGYIALNCKKERRERRKERERERETEMSQSDQVSE